MKGTRPTRWSLRFNVALLVVAVVLAPLVLVAAWLVMERQFEYAMRRNAVYTVKEAAEALHALPVPSAQATAPLGEAPAETALERVARVHRVRIRVLSDAGVVLVDHDYDWGRDLSERAGGLVLRHGWAQPNAPADDLLGPIWSRAELREVIEKSSVDGCEDAAETGMVLCFAVQKLIDDGSVRFVHVQDSAERPLPLLYALRSQLGRLTLVVLPFALWLAFWAGRRLVGPLEALRDQVLGKVREVHPRADLSAPSSNETAQLAQAFNTLLERLQERRSANAEFVADLVHEFKNPVAAIRACGESLASNDVTPERAQRIARLLHESSTRLDALVSQFLDLARAEAGMREEAREPIDLAVLARARVAAAAADPRWASLRFEIEASGPTTVRGVSERLHTVLDNLLTNAASFAAADGKVSVHVSSVGSFVELRVKDDGPGIEPEDAPHVFERFFTTRRHDKGTGLGLALVRAIVIAHGGEVAVESELGRGATFIARLPAPSA